MNKTAESGEENHYYELDSVKKETDAGIYDDVASESATPVTQQTSYENCMQGVEEKRQASTEHECACQCDTVVLRRMLFVVAAVAVVGLVTAIATLILALTAMKPRNDSSTAKVQDFDSTGAIKSEDYDRIKEIYENFTTLVKKMEQHLKTIHGLENLLNFTSCDHCTALWLAGNFTNTELRRVWTAVNSTQIDLLRQLNEVKDNLTEQVNDVSKMAGPIGPPGHNGSQGPAGDFSSCQYIVKTEAVTPGLTWAIATETEPKGMRITGATCSTNFAAEYNLLSQLQAGGKWRYVCSCKGTSTLFRPRGTKNCYLHYWECPLTT